MPATKPLVNRVFPLPNSPCKAKTEPTSTPSASRRPSASVSTGPLEMNVATFQLRMADCRLRIQTANSSNRQFREFSSPFSYQAGSVTWRNGKEQLVIFALGNCVIDLRAAGERQILHLDGKSDSAGLCKSWKIGSQPVA